MTHTDKSEQNKKMLYINFAAEKIPVQFVTKKRASRSITIKINPDCQVIVAAPPFASSEDIMAAVNKRARWIHNKLQFVKSQQPYRLTWQYVSGESHYYLGEKYRLQVLEESSGKPYVKLAEGYLQVVTARDAKHVQQLLAAWYKQRAHDVFAHRLAALIPGLSWIKKAPELRIRGMRSRWGSCSTKGHITLNTHLVKAPTLCIDYVILHELCHIAEHNHGPKFYRLLEAVCPNWKDTKAYLDKTTGLYLM